MQAPLGHCWAPYKPCQPPSTMLGTPCPRPRHPMGDALGDGEPRVRLRAAPDPNAAGHPVSRAGSCRCHWHPRPGGRGAPPLRRGTRCRPRRPAVPPVGRPAGTGPRRERCQGFSPRGRRAPALAPMTPMSPPSWPGLGTMVPAGKCQGGH